MLHLLHNATIPNREAFTHHVFYAVRSIRAVMLEASKDHHLGLSISTTGGNR